MHPRSLKKKNHMHTLIKLQSNIMENLSYLKGLLKAREGN